MLVEPQLAVGPQDPGDLGQRLLLAGHRAQHQRGDGRVEGAVVSGKRAGVPGGDLDRDRGGGRGGFGVRPQDVVGFDGEDLGDGDRCPGRT